MADIKIVSNGTAALTDVELAVMDAMVERGDRAGYDIVYFAMTGNDAVAGEAQVATFSERPGSVAFGANRLMQEAFKDIAKAGQAQYRGIYFLSQEVALHGLDAVRQDLIDGGTGLLTNNEYFDSATKAWQDNLNTDYFPGNLIIAAGGWDLSYGAGIVTAGVQATGLLTQFITNIASNSAALMVDPVLGAIRQSSNPGLLASVLATWVGATFAGAIFGKTDANMASQERIEGPDGFGLYVADGRVVAATGTSGEGALAVAMSAVADTALAAAVAGLTISGGPLAGLSGAALITALRSKIYDLITEPVGASPDPTMFSEFLAPVGASGDTQTSPYNPYQDTGAPSWSAAGTDNSDVLFAANGSAEGGQKRHAVLCGLEVRTTLRGVAFVRVCC